MPEPYFWISYRPQSVTLLKKRIWHRYSLVNFTKFVKISLFIAQLQWLLLKFTDIFVKRRDAEHWLSWKWNAFCHTSGYSLKHKLKWPNILQISNRWGNLWWLKSLISVYISHFKPNFSLKNHEHIIFLSNFF